MENLTITKEVKFLDSIQQWCVGVWCKEYGIWTGGYFHKDIDKATELAMKSCKKSIDFKRECLKATERQELVLNY